MHEELRKFLRLEYTRRKSANSSYSLRAFARAMGIGSAALSEIMNGKRNPSERYASNLLSRLNVDERTRQKTLYPSRAKRVGSRYETLTHAVFESISNWYHFAILSLAETQGFVSDPHWIARRLSLPITSARQAIERLKTLELLVAKDDGRLEATNKSYSTSDGEYREALISAHAQNLDLARQALFHTKTEEHDFTAMTMAIDPELLPMARERIREALDDISETLESGNRSEVYKIGIQLFPLSKEI